MHFLRNLHRVAVRLPVDVQQHRGLAVCRNNRVHRLDRRSDRRHIPHTNRNARGRGLDHGVGDFFRRADLGVDKTQK